MLNVITHPAFIWSAAVLVVLGIIMLIIAPYVGSYIAYIVTLKRGKKSRWSREMPKDLPPDSQEMYKIGLAWSAENGENKTDLHIVNSDGMNLYGEYYDFGAERCVMVLSGRTESLRYGYYFAIPYARLGYNVLVMDPRAHGLSDGQFNTAGFEESGDVALWAHYIVDTYGIKFIIYHGICIGSAAGLYSIVDEKCPKEVRAIVAEGMFPNFGESVRNHMIEQKRETKRSYPLIVKWMKLHTGHSMLFGPIDVIHKLKLPLLMLHSKEDLYSTPEYAQKLYELAGSEDKSLVWFERGKHSMLRITDTERYDTAIAEFVSRIENEEKEKNYVL